MELLHDKIDVLPSSVSVAAAIGVFDGVHLGHRAVFNTVRVTADQLDVASAVVTFDIHPAHVVRPENAPKLLGVVVELLKPCDSQAVRMREANLEDAFVHLSGRGIDASGNLE